MAVKTITEADGSVKIEKQSDSWLKERLNGVLQSISASGGVPNLDDIKAFKDISDEIKKRSI